jgi:hypothetical protein
VMLIIMLSGNYSQWFLKDFHYGSLSRTNVCPEFFPLAKINARGVYSLVQSVVFHREFLDLLIIFLFSFQVGLFLIDSLRRPSSQGNTSTLGLPGGRLQACLYLVQSLRFGDPATEDTDLWWGDCPGSRKNKLWHHTNYCWGHLKIKIMVT